MTSSRSTTGVIRSYDVIRVPSHVRGVPGSAFFTSGGPTFDETQYIATVVLHAASQRSRSVVTVTASVHTAGIAQLHNARRVVRCRRPVTDGVRSLRRPVTPAAAPVGRLAVRHSSRGPELTASSSELRVPTSRDIRMDGRAAVVRSCREDYYTVLLHLFPFAFGQCSITIRRQIRQFVIERNTSINSTTDCPISKTDWTLVIVNWTLCTTFGISKSFGQ